MLKKDNIIVRCSNHFNCNKVVCPHYYEHKEKKGECDRSCGIHDGFTKCLSVTELRKQKLDKIQNEQI